MMAFDSFSRFKYDRSLLSAFLWFTFDRITTAGMAAMQKATIEEFPEASHKATQNSEEPHPAPTRAFTKIISTPMKAAGSSLSAEKDANLQFEVPSFDELPAVTDLSVVLPDEWQSPEKQGFLYKKGTAHCLYFQLDIHHSKHVGHVRRNWKLRKCALCHGLLFYFDPDSVRFPRISKLSINLC